METIFSETFFKNTPVPYIKQNFGKKYKNKTKYSLIKQQIVFLLSCLGCFKTRTRVIRLLHLDSCFTRPMFMGLLFKTKIFALGCSCIPQPLRHCKPFALLAILLKTAKG